MTKFSDIKSAIAILLTSTLLTACQYGAKINTKNQGEVYYKKPIQKADAIRAGELLDKLKFFDNTGRKTMQLIKKKERIQIRFVVKKSAMQDEKVVKSLTFISGLLSHLALNHQPVELNMCDKMLKTVRSISVDKKIGNVKQLHKIYNGDILLQNDIDQATIKKVGNVLIKTGFLGPKVGPKSVLLKKGDQEYTITFVANIPIKAENREIFKILAFSLSKDAFAGKRVKTILADDSFEAVEKLDPVEVGKTLKYGLSELYYTSNVDQAIATKLKDYLGQIKYFEKNASRGVHVDKRENKFIVEFVIKKGFEKDPSFRLAMVPIIQKLEQFFQNKKNMASNNGSKFILVDAFFRPLDTI